jgi:septal ring factor EnvC (AmiA/AmiB activator)
MGIKGHNMAPKDDIIDMTREKQALDEQAKDFQMREGQRSGSAIDNNSYVAQLEEQKLEHKQQQKRDSDTRSMLSAAEKAIERGLDAIRASIARAKELAADIDDAMDRIEFLTEQIERARELLQDLKDGTLDEDAIFEHLLESGMSYEEVEALKEKIANASSDAEREKLRQDALSENEMRLLIEKSNMVDVVADMIEEYKNVITDIQAKIDDLELKRDDESIPESERERLKKELEALKKEKDELTDDYSDKLEIIRGINAAEYNDAMKEEKVINRLDNVNTEDLHSRLSSDDSLTATFTNATDPDGQDSGMGMENEVLAEESLDNSEEWDANFNNAAPKVNAF